MPIDYQRLIEEEIAKRQGWSPAGGFNPPIPVGEGLQNQPSPVPGPLAAPQSPQSPQVDSQGRPIRLVGPLREHSSGMLTQPPTGLSPREYQIALERATAEMESRGPGSIRYKDEAGEWQDFQTQGPRRFQMDDDFLSTVRQQALQEEIQRREQEMIATQRAEMEAGRQHELERVRVSQEPQRAQLDLAREQAAHGREMDIASASRQTRLDEASAEHRAWERSTEADKIAAQKAEMEHGRRMDEVGVSRQTRLDEASAEHRAWERSMAERQARREQGASLLEAANGLGELDPAGASQLANLGLQHMMEVEGDALRTDLMPIIDMTELFEKRAARSALGARGEEREVAASILAEPEIQTMLESLEREIELESDNAKSTAQAIYDYAERAGMGKNGRSLVAEAVRDAVKRGASKRPQLTERLPNRVKVAFAVLMPGGVGAAALIPGVNRAGSRIANWLGYDPEVLSKEESALYGVGQRYSQVR